MFIPLIATAVFSHRGRKVTVGQAINATPVEALAYTYQRIAKFTGKPEAVAPIVEPRRTARRRRVTAETE